MTITSFSYFALITIGSLAYYILPSKIQWIELLILSIIFYIYASVPYTIVYLIVSTLIAYFSTMWIYKSRKHVGNNQIHILILTVIAVITNILVWFVLKGRGLWVPFAQFLLDHVYVLQINSLLNVEFVASLGMGYYTLQMIGYIIDCYWENIEPQKNPLKLFLFNIYFPQLVNGPISKYSQLTSLYESHNFLYQNIAFGTQRILWGVMKKIVLAERIGIVISAITQASGEYRGFYSWIVILLYPIQIYADFSGGVDIVLGTSELFDIHLAENFKNPFFSRTSQEFWQRWHITLGTWAKDYVLYPLLKSKRMINFGKKTRKIFGRKVGKFLVNAVGMFILWMVMGIWHGGFRYIVGVSLWYWIILMTGYLLAPLFETITNVLNIKTKSFSWHLFQSCRTYLIYSIGAVFFHIGIRKGITLLLDAWKVLTLKGYANPWIFFDESILEMGITYQDINICILAVIAIIIVAVLREKYGYARIWVQNQCLIFRWFIWITLFVIVIIYGKYGPEYDATTFIYQGF